MADNWSVGETFEENIQLNDLVISDDNTLSGARNKVVTSLSQDPENHKTGYESLQFSLKVDTDASYIHVRESPDMFDNVRDNGSVGSSRLSIKSDDTSNTSELANTQNKRDTHIELVKTSKKNEDIPESNPKAEYKSSWEESPRSSKLSKISTSKQGAVKSPFCTPSVTSRDIGINIHHGKDDVEFLNDFYLETLLNDVGEVWCEVFVLMGIPFATIETAMSKTDGQTKLNDILLHLLCDWRDKQSHRSDRGIPMLLAALRKGGRWIESISVQKALKLWRERQTSNDHPLFRWLKQAYKDLDIYIPGEYPRPLSDQFYAMLAPRMRATPELASALSLSMTELQEVRQKDVYTNDTMACMKILILFRAKGGSDVAVLDAILTALEEEGFLDARNTAITSLRGWLKRTADDDDVLLLPVKQLLNKHVPSDHRQSACAHREFASHRRRLDQQSALKILQARPKPGRHDT